METLIWIAVLILNLITIGMVITLKIRTEWYKDQFNELDGRNTQAQVELQKILDGVPLAPEPYEKVSRCIGILQGEDDV